MTEQEKHNYLLRFQRFQQSREKFFAPKLNKIINAQYQTVIDHAYLGIKAIDQIDSIPLTRLLYDIYFDAGIVYGAKIRADLNSQKARMPMGFSERMQQLITEYFGPDILNTSTGITETTKQLIRDVFINAYAQGLGIDDIVKQSEKQKAEATYLHHKRTCPQIFVDRKIKIP